jgi:hypothetical protein
MRRFLITDLSLVLGQRNEFPSANMQKSANYLTWEFRNYPHFVGAGGSTHLARETAKRNSANHAENHFSTIERRIFNSLIDFPD